MKPTHLPHSRIYTFDDQAQVETKTTCPACKGMGVDLCVTCKGCGKSSLQPIGGSRWRWVMCDDCAGVGQHGVCLLCRGAKMVSASSASGFRLRMP